MGNLLPKCEINTLILGNKKCGKSTLLTNIIVKNKDNNYYETLGFNIEILKIYDKFTSFWELGGKSKIQKLWKMYYNTIKFNIVILILGPFDYSNLDKEAFHKDLNLWNYISNEYSLMDLPLMIIINDLNKECLYFTDEEKYRKEIKKIKKNLKFDKLIQKEKELIMLNLTNKDNYLLFWKNFYDLIKNKLDK